MGASVALVTLACLFLYLAGALAGDPAGVPTRTNTSDIAIARVLTGHERLTNTVVPRRATVHDVGTGLTHKRIICWKRYAEGKEPHLVARETYHSLEAVDRCLGQYDRVRHCRLEGLTPDQTAHALGCGLPLVREYLAIDDLLEKTIRCQFIIIAS